MSKIEADAIGETYGEGYDSSVDNVQLIAVNKAIRTHPVEIVGEKLRSSMTAMKKLL
jgi:ketol-acid reductoisomerase